jgi:hypothetical protein
LEKGGICVNQISYSSNEEAQNNSYINTSFIIQLLLRLTQANLLPYTMFSLLSYSMHKLSHTLLIPPCSPDLYTNTKQQKELYPLEERTQEIV